MRFSLLLALALAGLTMAAVAEKHQQTKAKSSYTEEKEKKGGKSALPVKAPAARASTSQELRRVEQSSAKVLGSGKTQRSKVARTDPALKGQKKDQNPPIHFASSGGSGKGNKSKGGDELKGRLRHKGSRH